MNKLRIAQVAPIAERVPPKKYGGTERVVYALTEELVKRGHEVTLFASGDSISSAKIESVYPRALREDDVKDSYGVNNWTTLNIGQAYAKQGEFDIIHDHMAPISLPTANISTTPVVMTMHNTFSRENRNNFALLDKPNIVTISNSQIVTAHKLNHLGMVYNGLEMKHYPFGAESEGYLLYVGRISPEKGTHHCVQVARALDARLIIAAKLDEQNREYFETSVKPFLNDRITWIGEVDEEERNELMSRSKCLLHPVVFREPFGLTLIESMACGAPVIAFDRGAIPEIVVNGKTGFVVQDVEGMIDAVEELDSIDREACRKHSLENFNAQKMADGYEALYEKLLNL